MTQGSSRRWHSAASGSQLRHPHWRYRARRWVGAAVIVAAVVVPGYLLAVRHSDDGDATQDVVSSEVERRAAGLTESLEDPKTGISARWPDGWTQRERDGAHAFRSPDGKLVISISAPAPARDADELRSGAIDSVREESRKATVGYGKGRQIGGLQAEGAVIDATQRSGDRVRILIAVARGRERAYLLQVLSARDVPAETLVDGQLILGSIELSR